MIPYSISQDQSNSNDDAEKFVKWYRTPSHRISQTQMMMLRSLSNDTLLHLTGSVKLKWWCWEVCQMIPYSISQDQSNSNDDAEKFVKWYCAYSYYSYDLPQTVKCQRFTMPCLMLRCGSSEDWWLRLWARLACVKYWRWVCLGMRWQ